MFERMLNKQATPTIEEMTEFCGENAERFTLLNEWITSVFDTEQKMFFLTEIITVGELLIKRKISLYAIFLPKTTLLEEHLNDIKILLSVKCSSKKG